MQDFYSIFPDRSRKSFYGQNSLLRVHQLKAAQPLLLVLNDQPTTPHVRFSQ